MTDQNSSSPKPSHATRIQNPRAADYLLDPKRGWRFFFPFLAAEHSAAELGKIVDAPLNQVHYHVQQMLEWDLIKVARVKARAGRSIKYYRATFTACYIPFTQTKEISLETVMIRNDTLWTQWQTINLTRVRQAQCQDWGWLCYFQAGLGVRHELRPETEDFEPLRNHAPSILDHWVLLSLTQSNAKALQLEFDALVQRYLALVETQSSPTQLHLLRAAMTPVVT